MPTWPLPGSRDTLHTVLMTSHCYAVYWRVRIPGPAPAGRRLGLPCLRALGAEPGAWQRAATSNCLLNLNAANYTRPVSRCPLGGAEPDLPRCQQLRSAAEPTGTAGRKRATELNRTSRRSARGAPGWLSNLPETGLISAPLITTLGSRGGRGSAGLKGGTVPSSVHSAFRETGRGLCQLPVPPGEAPQLGVSGSDPGHRTSAQGKSTGPGPQYPR